MCVCVCVCVCVYISVYKLCFAGGSEGEEFVHNAGDLASVFPCREDPLEKEMATHSSILAWRIPWIEVPGR